MSVTLENVVALCKRRGFIYPSAEIYGGLNGVYDTGHLGVLIKNRSGQRNYTIDIKLLIIKLNT